MNREPHLGDSAAALVDGELGEAERDRALLHLTTCAACRREVDAQRGIKARLTRLDPPEVPVDAEFVARLRDLPMAADPIPSAPSGTPDRVSLRVVHPAASRTHRIRARVLISGIAASVVAVLVAAFAAGGSGTPPDRGHLVNPASGRYAVEHARTSGEIPLTNSNAVFGISYPVGGPVGGP